MSNDSLPLWARVDPTHPSRWGRVREMGKPAFLVRFGVGAVGIPLALLLNAALLALRGDADLLVSVRNAFELTYTLLLVAPLGGALAGQVLWSLGERRFAPLESDVFESTEAHDPKEFEADLEQRRLSALSQQLETIARTSPERLTRRVLAMTALGYGYVLLAVVLLAAGVVWLATVRGAIAGLARQMAWLLGGFGLLVLSALRVRLIEPQGRRVTRAGSPQLFDALDEIQSKLDVQAPDVVLIDGQLNASVSEIPRHGIFGLPKRYLVIGLPLLDALPSDECRAILAHELAHLSRRHTRRLAWVGRLSITWQSLAVSLESGRHWGRALFLPFFRWYAPRFELYANAIARRDEYESDALAAECVGASIAARALLRLHINQQFLTESFLPTVLRQSADRAEPPAGVFEGMAAALRTSHARHDVVRLARVVLGEHTLDAHSHPSLADRVRAVGFDLGDGELAAESAADLLGDASGAENGNALIGHGRVTKLRGQVEAEWQIGVMEMWRELSSDASIWKASGDVPMGEWSADILSARIRWSAECEPPTVALAFVREQLRRVPDHLLATVYLGRLLAESGDEQQRAEGIVLLEDMLRRDALVALMASETLEARYARLGWRADVERVQTRVRHLREAMLRGFRERQQLRASDHFTPYVLSAPALAALQAACAAQENVTAAFLIRKRTEYLCEQPCVMLAVECTAPWYKFDTTAAASRTCSALVDQVAVPEAADLFVVPVERRSRLLRRLRSVSGSECYRRT